MTVRKQIDPTHIALFVLNGPKLRKISVTLNKVKSFNPTRPIKVEFNYANLSGVLLKGINCRGAYSTSSN